jgi:hypothetical protein
MEGSVRLGGVGVERLAMDGLRRFELISVD